MALSDIDTLVLIPLIPRAPLAVTWYMPWDRWIPWGKLPKALLGPYVLYVAFAAWYFEFDPWMIGLAAVIGVGVSVWAVVEKLKKPAAPSTPDERPKSQIGEG